MTARHRGPMSRVPFAVVYLERLVRLLPSSVLQAPQFGLDVLLESGIEVDLEFVRGLVFVEELLAYRQLFSHLFPLSEISGTSLVDRRRLLVVQRWEEGL